MKMLVEKLMKMEKGLLAMITIYMTVILLMLPLREVGYHMDFGYHHAVRDFLQSGILKNHTAVVPSFILQELWGALFSYLLGFSYKTLHISVIVLFFFGIIAFYKTSINLRYSFHFCLPSDHTLPTRAHPYNLDTLQPLF